MSRVDGHDVAGTEAVGQPRTAGRPARQRGGPVAKLFQPGGAGIPAVPVAKIVGQDLGDELERQKETVAHQRRGAGERPQLAAELIQLRAHQKPERLFGDHDFGPSRIDPKPAGERGHERAREHHRRAAAVEPDRNASLAAKSGDGHFAPRRV